MSIDNLFKGVDASVYSRHPNGKFEALVKDAVMAFTQDNKRQFLKLVLLTIDGKAPDYRIFVINDSDALRAEHDPDVKEKLIKSIAINKGVLVRLGLVTEEIAKGWGQNEMLKAYASLKDKKVSITIEDDLRDPKYQKVNINNLILAGLTSQNETKAKNSVANAPIFSLDDIPF
jgi:hypothetical protein